MKLSSYINKIGYVYIILLFLILLDPFTLAFAFSYLLFVVVIVFKKDLFFSNVDKDFVILLFFSITYSLFNVFGENKGFQYLIIQAVFPAFFYVFGKTLILKGMSKNNIVFLLLSVTLIYSSSSLISVILDLLKGGFAQSDRTIPIIWTGEGKLATGMSGYLKYNVMIPAIIIANRKKLNLGTKGILIVLFVASLLSGFRLGSRTLVVITVFTLFLSLVIVTTKQKIGENFKLYFGLSIITLLILTFVPLDLDADYLSALGHRLNNADTSSAASAGGRTELWMDGLEKVFTQPLGWKSSHFHHNMWLDAAKVSGVIPVFFLLFNNVRSLYFLKSIFSFKGDNLGLNVIFTLYYFGSYMFFFTEPVLEGSFFTFTLFCLFQGILMGYINLYKTSNQPNLIK